eukprot:gene24980-32550_t
MKCSCIEICNQLEKTVQRDEGNRGIRDILTNDLYLSTELIVKSNSIAIITGFPCLIDYEIPTETDGPPGALAIARAALFVADRFDSKDLERLNEIIESIDVAIAIERPGRNHEGKYLTMSGRDMTHLIAPFESLFTNPRIKTIGIGDGGNELGMGKVYDRILSSSIVNAKTIASTVSTDYLIVCSVSNWGGYALAASVSLLTTCNECFKSDSYIDLTVYTEILTSCLPTSHQENAICQGMIDAGARDGITKSNEKMVDGFELV